MSYSEITRTCRLSLARAQSQAARSEELELSVEQRNIVEAWRNARRTRDYTMGRQLLSLFIAQRGRGLSYGQIANVASLCVPVVVGSSVLVQLKERNARARGIVAACHDSESGVLYDIRPPVTCGRGRAATGFMSDVPARQVEHEHSIMCR